MLTTIQLILIISIPTITLFSLIWYRAKLKKVDIVSFEFKRHNLRMTQAQKDIWDNLDMHQKKSVIAKMKKEIKPIKTK